MLGPPEDDVFPIRDDNPTLGSSSVTVAIVALNALVWAFVQGLGSEAALVKSVCELGAIPGELLGRIAPGTTVPLGPGIACVIDAQPHWSTALTHMFLHGGWFHLIGNLWFLWVFGDNVEDAMGHLRFIMFYLMCGIFAAVVHSWIMPTSELPLIGASGAVAGIISAYLILHPKVKIWVLALWRIPIKITAYWALGFWILAQFANLLIDTEESVAWGAHIGGLAAGAVLILFMRRRGVSLFDRTRGGA
jgi:membrane associated rhomboid family serine protease